MGCESDQTKFPVETKWLERSEYAVCLPCKNVTAHIESVHDIIAASIIETIQDAGLDSDSAPDVRLSVLKTSSKPILVVFTQLVSLTSCTSSGSAKVISTHCNP